jgi:hypothetical protein
MDGAVIVDSISVVMNTIQIIALTYIAAIMRRNGG